MSKPIKQLMQKSYADRFTDIDGAVIVNIRGIDANTNNDLRAGLAEKEIKITVVRNSLAKTALSDSELAPLTELFDGPTAMVYGGESVVNVAREIVDIVKKIKTIEIKGAIMEGQVFGPNEVDALSKYPTREEAQAELIQLILSPAGNIIGAATSAGSQIASILSTIEEKLEAGESIEKVAG